MQQLLTEDTDEYFSKATPVCTHLLSFCFVFVLFCFVLFCFVLFCFVLFCFVLFCFVLFCFALLCFVSFRIILLRFVSFGFFSFLFFSCPSSRQLISICSQEEKYVVAERIFKATIDDERFKKNSGVVQSFVQNQVRHHVVQARKKKLRLSYLFTCRFDTNHLRLKNRNSNSNNNTNNNSNYNDEESARIIEQWRDQHDFRTSSALVKLPNAQRPIDLQDAQRAIRQIQYPFDYSCSFIFLFVV